MSNFSIANLADLVAYVLLGLVVLFLALRVFFLWYWKVYHIVSLLTEIRDLLRSGVAQTNDSIAVSSPMRNGAVKAESRGRLGISLNRKVVSAVDPDSPADKAGVRTGDEILKADGKPLTGDGAQDVRLLAGAPGTKLILTVKRADHSRQDIEITRAEAVEAA